MQSTTLIYLLGLFALSAVTHAQSTIIPLAVMPEPPDVAPLPALADPTVGPMTDPMTTPLAGPVTAPMPMPSPIAIQETEPLPTMTSETESLIEWSGAASVADDREEQDAPPEEELPGTEEELAVPALAPNAITRAPADEYQPGPRLERAEWRFFRIKVKNDLNKPLYGTRVVMRLTYVKRTPAGVIHVEAVPKIIPRIEPHSEVSFTGWVKMQYRDKEEGYSATTESNIQTINEGLGINQSLTLTKAAGLMAGHPGYDGLLTVKY